MLTSSSAIFKAALTLSPAEDTSPVRHTSAPRVTVDPVQDLLLYNFSHDFHLSPREKDVVRLVVEGLTSGEMADRLGISPHTVRDHIKHIYKKTGTGSRSELLGLVTRTNAITAR